MKVLVATDRTQGERGTDYTWAVDGELVYRGVVCDRDQRDPDNGCGCSRAFAGMNSHRSTTTVAVRDLDLSVEDFTLALTSSLSSAGWDVTHLGEFIAEETADLLSLADEFRVGVVLERRLDDVTARTCA